MQKLGTKKTITLTKAQCEAAGIKTGDEVKVQAEREGVISIAKKQPETPNINNNDE